MSNIAEMQIAFENWALNAMPDLDETLLLGFCHKDGYTKSETINAMWVGFRGAYLTQTRN